MTTESETQPQQSWAAWFLDAYANSVIISHEDSTDDSAYDSMSPTMSEASNTESASPYGPYVKTGRGGAGNYQWQSRQTADVEGQKPMSLKEKRKAALAIESIDTSVAMKSRTPSQYVRVGRGGAGGYIQSNEPQASPTTTNFSKSPLTASSPVLYTGRGGAGNWNAARSASEQLKVAKESQDEAEREKRREQAALEVENMLQAPTQAYIGSRRRSTLPEDLEAGRWT